MQAGPVDPNPAFSSLPPVALGCEPCTCSRITSGGLTVPLHSLIWHCEPNLPAPSSTPLASRRPFVQTVEAAKLLCQPGFLYSFKSSSEYNATVTYSTVLQAARSWRIVEDSQEVASMFGSVAGMISFSSTLCLRNFRHSYSERFLDLSIRSCFARHWCSEYMLTKPFA